eukprot:TRINITY_DN929_c0_g1_i2.p1 TRINITY_DN929_c0_g1~~TRINITY_DN929_c0_g1_i2.p1  ORF type:complete len:479 (-),score=118.71 TRINITY_DN929_c0_g1_i2:51-1487(-)
MGKAPNATQQSLRLLAYSLGALAVLLFVVRVLLSYVPGVLSFALVLVACLIWAMQRSENFKAKSEQEALLMQHRAFAQEVELAWERSHHEAERRRGQSRHDAAGTASGRSDKSAISSQRQSQEVDSSTSSRKKKKKKANEDDEDLFIVDDELEAEVVEDLEDFLQHSRLRQTLKKTAGDMRESQKRKEEASAVKKIVLPPPVRPVEDKKPTKQEQKAAKAEQKPAKPAEASQKDRHLKETTQKDRTQKDTVIPKKAAKPDSAASSAAPSRQAPAVPPAPLPPPPPPPVDGKAGSSREEAPRDHNRAGHSADQNGVSKKEAHVAEPKGDRKGSGKSATQTSDRPATGAERDASRSGGKGGKASKGECEDKAARGVARKNHDSHFESKGWNGQSEGGKSKGRGWENCWDQDSAFWYGDEHEWWTEQDWWSHDGQWGADDASWWGGYQGRGRGKGHWVGGGDSGRRPGGTEQWRAKKDPAS